MAAVTLEDVRLGNVVLLVQLVQDVTVLSGAEKRNSKACVSTQTINHRWVGSFHNEHGLSQYQQKWGNLVNGIRDKSLRLKSMNRIHHLLFVYSSNAFKLQKTKQKSHKKKRMYTLNSIDIYIYVHTIYKYSKID
jgi:hypothetical protein